MSTMTTTTKIAATVARAATLGSRGRPLTRAAPCTNATHRLASSSSQSSEHSNEGDIYARGFQQGGTNGMDYYTDYDRVPRSMSPSASVRRFGTEASSAVASVTYSMPFRHEHIVDPSSPSLSFKEDYDQWNLYDAPASVTRSDLGLLGSMTELSEDYANSDVVPLPLTIHDDGFDNKPVGQPE